MERAFAIKFVIQDGQIRTEMHNQGVNPQEILGLLDMAKSQVLDSLKTGRQEIFKGEFKKDD